MAKPTKAMSNETLQSRLSVRERQSTAGSQCFSSVVREKQDILNGTTNSSSTEKLVEAIQPGGVCASSILVVSCETDCGDEKQGIPNGTINSSSTEKLVEAIQPGVACESLILNVSCETDCGDEKQGIPNGTTNSSSTEKLVKAIQPVGVCESSILVVSCETDSGDETVEEKNSRNEPHSSKDKFLLTDVSNEDGARRSCQPASLVPIDFEKDSSSNSEVDTEDVKDSDEKLTESEEKLRDSTLPGAFVSCSPAVCYHQSSILLLACETELSSESGEESDVKIDSVDKSLEGREVTSSAGELKVFTSSDQTPKIERDSGIVLSRATTVSNQSSLLVISHDTDYSTDEHQQKSDTNVKSQEVGKEDLLQTTSSSDDKWKNERFSQKLDAIEVCTLLLLVPVNYDVFYFTDICRCDSHLRQLQEQEKT